jgi:RNA:NAD 2'-phosphotransferase (TPT1/KptA family)
MQQNIDVLQRMKDYDEEVEIERAKAVIEEEQKQRFEVRNQVQTSHPLSCRDHNG